MFLYSDKILKSKRITKHNPSVITFTYIHSVGFNSLLYTHTHTHNTHTHTQTHTNTHTRTHTYIYANFIKHNRYFMPTYFLLNPFEFPYYFYRIRGELIYVLSIVVCIPSTFWPTLGYHQGESISKVM